ncbi:MAG: hypothetical protein UV60_C0007G0012 [Parcubacteria group bacterium GW2011_GWA2_43_11]|nr:MAG: hypothetical protein UV60_C0007G0012 [Parcubacteria group bacterium GW2011_GWA2_43_11]
MLYHIYMKTIFTSLLPVSFAVLCAGTLGFFLPTSAYAEYSFHGRTFETQEEMQVYASSYLSVWKDLHGYPSNSTGASHKPIKTELEITTRNVTDITKEGVRFVGLIDFHKSKVARIWFEYGFTPNNLVYKTDSEVLKTKTGASPFDRKVLYLLPRTTYYYRAVGLNEHGTYDYGEVKSFTTGVDSSLDTALIRVRTGSATAVDNNRATLRGTIDFRKAEYSYVWFEYGEEESDLYRQTPKTLVYKLQGRNYEYPVMKLGDETPYYYRTVGQDSAGDLSYGKTMRFMTQRYVSNEKPKVVTNATKNVQAHSATVSGNVDMNTSRNGVAFMVYGEDQTAISTIARTNTRYKDIRPRGDVLQKVLLDADLDTYQMFTRTIQYLDLNTKHYFALGVEYEDAEGDDVLLMGKTQSFTTKKQ